MMIKSTNLDKISTILSKNKQFQNAIEIINKKKRLSIKFLAGSLPSFLAEFLYSSSNDRMIYLCHDTERALQRYHDLAILLGKEHVIDLFEVKSEVKNLIAGEGELNHVHIDGLVKIISTEKTFSIATPEIFTIEFPNLNEIVENRVELSKGLKIEMQEFSKSMFLAGYERKDFVANEGDIALRGGILDIFPPGFVNPLRIEFWGDEIESIREFEPISQRSIRNMEHVKFSSKVFHQQNTEINSNIWSIIGTENTIVIIEEPEQFEEGILELLPSNINTIFINGLAKADVNLKSHVQPKFDSSIKNFIDFIESITGDSQNIFLSAEGNIHLERLQRLIANAISETSELAHLNEKFKWAKDTISSGFYLDDLSLFCFTEHELFARYKNIDKPRTSNKVGITLKELSDLKLGDLVVHDDKGVGRFEGFSKIKIGGNAQEVVRLVFDGGDVLYVSMNYIQKLRKYSATEGSLPRLSKLGSSEWVRKKERTKKKLKDIARDLIKLYAERKLKKGFSYPTDTTWQQEFEASFIYEDTIDQAKTTLEVKRDMESEIPMDRLVCGDVGFGKTEIAIRAAFKAVQAGKQVAVLVPTTVLAEQHYMTFRDRLNHYPVKVDAISRFKSKAMQNVTVDGVKAGNVDILIGTHRILSKDINFKDLGLLIIDEEQRFGVAAKEKLRSLKVNIDTLTLTATPIPRTLNFSLMGARDLSIIETPPRNRRPVQTEIIEFEYDQIKEAIEKEISRKGQVFIVSDKILDLEKLMLDLKMLVPQAKFGLAHGQMSPKQLEDVMRAFISGKVDVLVTTKIVESGIDIPNANTMLINRANNFGLAELYQLRGRVGRSNTQAYCYLLVEKGRKLTQTGLKRLQAIEEFTDLGSGFKLALRDMEIRGAGNLLGGEQSGMITDIGFELYQKILEEAVLELKHQEFSEIFGQESEEEVLVKIENEEVIIEINSDALLPETYIKNDTERFGYYKKLYSLRNFTDLRKMTEELEDKYGRLPEEGKELIFAVKLRIASISTGFERVAIKQNSMLVEFPDKSKEVFYQKAFPAVMDYINGQPNSQLKQVKDKLFWEISIDNREQSIELLWKIKKTIEMMLE